MLKTFSVFSFLFRYEIILRDVPPRTAVEDFRDTRGICRFRYGGFGFGSHRILPSILYQE